MKIPIMESNMELELIEKIDPEVAASMKKELNRQRNKIELIASENFVSPAVMAAAGSHLTKQIRRGLFGQTLLRRLRIR